ncbi:MAG: hypothetical protein WAU75_24480 [Solirubrobacteraceae bacterium]
MATQIDMGQRPEDAGAPGASPTDAQAKAQQAAGQAQEKAQAAAGQAQAKVRDQLDQRSSQLAEQAHQQASDLRSVSEALREQGKDRPAQAVDRLAGYAEQAGSYLRDADADSMLSDAEDFGRRKPGAVAAGALALGLVASRFLKASSSRRYSVRETEQPRVGTRGSEMPPSMEPLPVTSSQPPTSPVEPLPVTADQPPTSRPGI